jgi:anti-anti-sigma factor
MPTDPAFEPFRVDVHHEDARIRVVPVGELDLATAPAVDDALRAAYELDQEAVAIDLRKVIFMDSSGLRLILRWNAAARDQSRRFGVIPGDEVVQRVFEATRVAEHLTFVEP